MDDLDRAGSVYNESIYAGFGESTNTVEKKAFFKFVSFSLRYIDQSIWENKRADSMYLALLGNLFDVREELSLGEW